MLPDLMRWAGLDTPSRKESFKGIFRRGEVRDACRFSVNSPNYFKFTKTP
jgi:hypothetical protein